jgi:hypothetical protein
MTTSTTDIIRRGLIKIDPARVLGLVDELDLRPSARVTAVVGVPLRSLQQRRDVASFAAGAPLPAVRAVLELLALEPLEKVVEALGDHAESPTFEQLSEAIEQVRASGTGDDDVVAVLCFAVGEAFPAAPHCRRLLEEREEWRLPELPAVASTTLVAPSREVDPALKEARRQRREQQRRKKVTSAPPRHAKAPKATLRDDQRVDARATETPSVIERRSARLTPRESALYETAHPLAGSVILALVPFDAVDPAAEEATAKERPALVVAASANGALVRGIYSQQFANRSVFAPWRRLRLDHVSFISDERVGVELASAPVVLGELTSEEWNGLF